mgnify:CR=1 FL=1
MMIKALIVEDEQSSREILKGYLERYCPEITLVAMADSVKPALELIRLHKPNLVFLDIEMPFGNGFDLLDQVQEINFEIIFTTAFSNYALQAIQVSASHYLLKPIKMVPSNSFVAILNTTRNYFRILSLSVFINPI